MTKEEIYEEIVKWELSAGESFFDYFDGNVNGATYIGFLLGKGYVEFANKASTDINKPVEERKYFTCVDMNELGEVFPQYEDEQWSEKNYEKNIRLFAEFLSLTDVYQKRFADFLNEN